MSRNKVHHYQSIYARVAQLVERETHKLKVGGSNPPLGTIFFNERQSRRLCLFFILKRLSVFGVRVV